MPGQSAISAKTDSVKIDSRSKTKVSDSKTGEPQAKAKSLSSRRNQAQETEEQEAARTQAPTSVQPVEPEDAYLTGVSRSLQRRLLGLNVSQAKPVPGGTAAGIHSTGSYTEGESVKPDKSPKASKNGKKK